MVDYKAYSIFAEHCFRLPFTLSTQPAGGSSYCNNCYNILPSFQHSSQQIYCEYCGDYSTSKPIEKQMSNPWFIYGMEWDFSISPDPKTALKTLYVKLSECSEEESETPVNIVFWYWHGGKQIMILKNSIKFLKKGQCEEVTIEANANISLSDGHIFASIRILREKPVIEKLGPCPPVNGSDEVAIHVGEQSFICSKHYLMSVSPVFRCMFTLEMKEKKAKEVEIDDLTPDEFVEFLEAISLEKVPPNPNNVLNLYRLADRYQVNFLRQSCEVHLFNCVEIPLLDRLVFADHYRLHKLKTHILRSMTGLGLLEFYEENLEHLKGLGKELILELTALICQSAKAILKK